MKNLFPSPIVSLKNISKKYFFTDPIQNKSKEKFFWALKDISFELSKGDSLGIVGANGSGKTTLLKILSQVISPTHGEIHLWGKLIPIIDIGSGFHPDLTGKENIFLYGTVMLGMTKTEINNNLEQIVEFSELGKFINEPIKNYSNGMYLRLALSVALFCKLDILLLDEVFSVGDNAFMLKSHDKINQIIKQAATVILASHNLNDIMRVCNKCLWLDKGEIKMIGNTNEVISAYMSSNKYLTENGAELDTLHLCCKKEWTLETAPQTEQVKLTAISVRNSSKATPETELEYTDSITVEIEYIKTEPNCEIACAIQLADHSNTPLLITSHCFDTESNLNFYGDTGAYRYACILPGQMFNLGIYKINLQISLNNTNPIIYISDALTFRIVSHQKVLTDILKRNPIKFAPILPWEITKLSTS